ncbi:hypothetical protein I6H96_02690 [Brucella anthropi]|uniref:Uncharacterized protein n=1 Tax=Brucella anthropi (strain ATCC 49188 / DSM 6882 / CCUG 24695 / JCM 21032 / LMG 3331 / NBRC 15819 / NCTC 12168 / Alc 37) TaxID=439375 RepID=A6WZ54_BRUA4|nr:hypothetical protein [Brucella anthropi]ABS14258.1 hypothetical protein Oant_1542 [Brucella anthropi ATCC 49188]NKC48145.1 hypothetical protein [Brucella anthropi ATCC 49188]QQC25788.1 hypothetical protein I6H96_02690 [Brucella anthropi]RRY08854.1 hypothetical protein EGJ58_13225 [Brucella anthropi]SUA65427.1 Uncharacterised protein [Brucella anthropi]
MAKKAKMDTASATAAKGGVAPEDLKRVIAEIGRQKKHASEYAGLAGKATQNAVEQYGLEKNALTFSRRLSDMEDGKRQAIIRSSIEYWSKLGFFAQLDAFSDLIELMRAIVAEADGNDGKGKTDAVIAELVH